LRAAPTWRSNVAVMSALCWSVLPLERLGAIVALEKALLETRSGFRRQTSLRGRGVSEGSRTVTCAAACLVVGLAVDDLVVDLQR